MTYEERIKELEKRIRELEDRITKLENKPHPRYRPTKYGDK